MFLVKLAGYTNLGSGGGVVYLQSGSFNGGLVRAYINMGTDVGRQTRQRKRTVSYRNHVIHTVLKLTDISRPVICIQIFHCLGSRVTGISESIKKCPD